MENILRLLFIAFISIFGFLLSTNISSQAQSSHYLKEDLEIAVHDATLEILDSELSKGRIVFDQQKAMNTFKTSFEKNSGLTSEDYTIIEVAFLDDATVARFPHTYISTFESHQASFARPSLIVIVETKRNAYFLNNSTETFTKVASYSYKNVAPQLQNAGQMQLMGTPNPQGFVWPSVHTENITSYFGMRTHPITGVNKLHAGIDIASDGVNLTQTVSIKEGTVLFADALSTYGNVVIIDHGNGLQSRYAHLARIDVIRGQDVAQGQVVGLIGNTGGSTGPHLHFEIRINGIAYDPLIFYP